MAVELLHGEGLGQVTATSAVTDNHPQPPPAPKVRVGREGPRHAVRARGGQLRDAQEGTAAAPAQARDRRAAQGLSHGVLRFSVGAGEALHLCSATPNSSLS